MATVKLFGNLRKFVDSAQITLSGERVRDLLDKLCKDNPPLCEALLEDHGVRRHYKITLNGRDISHAQGLDTPVNEDDKIAIFPPIAGG